MVLFLAVALIPRRMAGRVSLPQASNSLSDSALNQVGQEATLTSRDRNTFLEKFSTARLSFRATLPVPGIIRARDDERPGGGGSRLPSSIC